MKYIVIIIVLCAVALGQLPDAPRSPIFTKKFVAAHVVYLTADIFDIETTHQGIAHHKCVEGGFNGYDAHPSRGGMYAQEMPIFGVLTGLDILLQSRHFPKAVAWVPYMAPIYGTAVHLHGGLQWYEKCW